MARPEIIVLASMHDRGLLIDVPRALLDVPAFRPNVGSSVPRVVRALVDIACPRRGDDHFAFRWRSRADFHLDSAGLCDSCAGEHSEGQCRKYASNPHSLSLTTLCTRSR